MPPNFKIAFIGDQGLGSASVAVLRMIRDEGADMVLHSGDFDYRDDPEGWDRQINQILGEDYPYFASIGNHDVEEWEGYQRKLEERLARINGAICAGDLGVNSSCTYRGLFFLLSGVGTIDSGRVSFISEALASEQSKNAVWRVCSWHKNQRLMQVGGKGNSAGWEPYEECRKAGAIIATGHEHSYSRTHLMDNFETQSIASKSSALHIEEGKSFAFVSGIAGYSIRGQDYELAANPWWAAVHTSDQGATHGALFCVLNRNGVENRGYCYFRDLNGVIADAFEIVAGHTAEAIEPSPSIHIPSLKGELEYSYAIDVPDDWDRRSENRFTSPSPRVRLEIISDSFRDRHTLDQFSRSARDNLRADWEDWWFTTSLFEITSVVEEITDKQMTVRIRYRAQESPEYCVLDVEEVLVAPLSPPEIPQTSQVFRARSWMCESRPEARKRLRADVLDTFEATGEFQPYYYTQFRLAKGVMVKARESVDPAALQAAAEIVDAMLSGREDLARCVALQGGNLAIIPRDQTNTDLPEFAYLAGTSDFTGRRRDTYEIRGLGGVIGQPVSSVGEEQLLGNWESHHPWYPYRGQVATHEFAHAIQNLCFTPEDDELWSGFYEAALAANLYPGSHMMNDVNEFFAVLSAVYFEVTRELGGVAAREDIKDRFPMIFQALDSIYGGAVLPEKFRVRLPRPS